MLTNLPGVFHVAAGWSLCSHSGQTLLLSSSQALEALGWGGGVAMGAGSILPSHCQKRAVGAGFRLCPGV